MSTKLEPIKFWCQKVLPLVYDDSLSYYEVLGKTVDYLNKVIEDDKNIIELVNNLEVWVNENKEYIDNYFENLNVQNEINVKLDEMVDDGTFGEIIDPILEQFEQDAMGNLSQQVSDWLEENITPTTPVIDATLTISGAGADAKVTGDEITDLKNALIPSSEKDLTIVIGTLDNGIDSTLNTRCKTLDYIPVSADDYVIFDDSSYQLSVTEYNENKEFISVSGWISANRYKVVSGGYIRAVIRRNDNADISDADIATAKENLYIFNVSTVINNITDSVNEINDSISDISFQNRVRNALLVGWQHTGNGGYYYHEPPTRNTITSPIYTDYKIVLSTDTSHLFALQFYDGYEIGADHLLSTTQWMREYTIQPGAYFCITLRNSDNSTTSEETNNYLTIQTSKPINLSVSSNSDALDLINNKTNYSVSESLKTRGVNLERMGILTYLQAFCKYNNSYYSTNGTNISVQDSTFAETNNVAINLGHGNSMQIGALHNNYAYVSGWNDQKVYVVNLDTLEIVDTITLPTTGYTTVAIDDVNRIAYIFQRNTYPSTEEFYNFIVYDYENNEIISTKKTYRAFSAMQAVDFYEGKIYVLNGLGTAESPNYYLIYNTSGGIIGEYIISDFSNTEPEGIYIDRETREIYLSLVNRTVYKMS